MALINRNKNRDLLSRFVVDGGNKKLGESVALDGDILIIKMERDFIGVPLKHVEDMGEFLKVRGLVDLDKAKLLGKKWEMRYVKSR
ncbi:MAG TPA: hypothetical protein ENG74_02870 [Thermoplasmatales archaeon]|nr:hypothetical protein [Thermoplasmatales archaeon]